MPEFAYRSQKTYAECMMKDTMQAFDRYDSFTDLAALKEFSSRPLRKSIRVNTLKTTVEEVVKCGKKKGWILEHVPWCPEGFFIDRVDRKEALGKDLLHLVGRIYMQEAASMLPVMLLDPRPSETILDMSAAPGSKTTQISARMHGKGVIIANDIQEKRLWTLKSAQHRAGATNVIITKKVGQWFAKHMTERFDRVLCDAPCTAQGTIRKDSDALEYCSMENIGKMAKLQRELLEAAVHATKVGGRIVYSTCTLTPEENEEVVLSVMHKFSDQLDIRTPDDATLDKAIHDSSIVQERSSYPLPTTSYPLVRLWPQTYDTEGFFCAVIQKNATTKAKTPVDRVRFQEDPHPRSRMKEFGSHLEEMFGTSFLQEGDALFEHNSSILLATEDVANIFLPVQDYALGIPFATRLSGGRLRLDHETATLRGHFATRSTLEVSEEDLYQLLKGQDIRASEKIQGDVILMFESIPVGLGLAREGKVKNNLLRWMVRG